jgi:hypothetical protein
LSLVLVVYLMLVKVMALMLVMVGLRSHARRQSTPPIRGRLAVKWVGPRRGEIWQLRSADRQLSGSMSTQGFSKNIIGTPTSRPPARLARYFFSSIDTSFILSCLRAEHVSEGSFGGDEGTVGFKLAADSRGAAQGVALVDNRPTM